MSTSKHDPWLNLAIQLGEIGLAGGARHHGARQGHGDGVGGHFWAGLRQQPFGAGGVEKADLNFLQINQMVGPQRFQLLTSSPA